MGDALSLLAEPQATELDRIQVAFDLLDKAESLLGYGRHDRAQIVKAAGGESLRSVGRWSAPWMPGIGDYCRCNCASSSCRSCREAISLLRLGRRRFVQARAQFQARGNVR